MYRLSNKEIQLDMLTLTALFLTLTAAMLIYITSKHQRFFSKPQPKRLAWVGVGLFVLALLTWLQVFAVTAAVFIWFFTSITLLISIPLSTLIIDIKALK